ncbi:MAG: hypothetical protein HUJ53_03840 [Holdemanella sp.]|nr:hypothetical protein [Holdemanella sp.]
MKKTVQSILAASMMFQFCLAPSFAKEEELPVEEVVVEEEKQEEIKPEENNVEEQTVEEEPEEEIKAEEIIYVETANISRGSWKTLNGRWVFQFEDGSYAENNRYLIGGKYYYFNGIYMHTGWLNVEGDWWYYHADGHEASGWLKIGNDWYYFIPEYENIMAAGFGLYEINGKGYWFDENGHWIANKWYKYEDQWYYFDKDGNLVTDGWVNDHGTWYYFEDGEYVQDDCRDINGYWYHFDESGAMITNKWINYGNEEYPEWSYYGADGKGAKGWLQLKGIWYYFNPEYDDIAFCNEWALINDKWYYFDENCAMLSNQWIQESAEYWSYLTADGNCARGWLQIKGVWYYFDVDNYDRAAQNQAMCINDAYYYFDDSCAMVSNKWIRVQGYWYYYGADGKRCFGWKLINGSWYYFVPELYGKMAFKGVEIDYKGYHYVFDDDGHYTETKL